MSAVIRLVESTGNDGGELPPLDQYEIWMQGRGLSHRTITESIYVQVVDERRIEAIDRLDPFGTAASYSDPIQSS